MAFRQAYAGFWSFPNSSISDGGWCPPKKRRLLVGENQSRKTGRKLAVEGGRTSRKWRLQTSGTGEGLGLTGRERRDGELRQTDAARSVMGPPAGDSKQSRSRPTPPPGLPSRLRPHGNFLPSTVSESPRKPATAPSRPRRCAGVPQWQTTYFRSSQAAPGGEEPLWRRAPGCREVETQGMPPPRQLKAWLATFEGLGVLAGLESWRRGHHPPGVAEMTTRTYPPRPRFWLQPRELSPSESRLVQSPEVGVG